MGEVKLSVVLPVFNEEKRLLAGFRKIHNYFSQSGYSYEVIIVNNGSTDRTESLAKEYITGKINWHYFSIPFPGKGEAVKKGFLQAKGTYVLFTDIDIPVSFDQLNRFWIAMESCDIAIGSKFTAQSLSASPVSILRKLASFAFNCLTRLLLDLPYADTQCGFKIFRRLPFLELIPNLRVKGLCFDAEWLMSAQKASLTVKEIPVRWQNSPQSSLKLSKASLHMFRDFLTLWWRKSRSS